TGLSVRGYGFLAIASDSNLTRTVACIAQGYMGNFQLLTVGQFQNDDFNATWVIQGTVAEDATAGTHICTLTVTPGAGSEFQVLYGEIIIGNTATAQLPRVTIDDGTNLLVDLLNAEGGTLTTASIRIPFPQSGNIAFSTLTT